MGKRPNLSKIEEFMIKGKDFSLNRTEYIRYTGIDLPQGKNYTEKKSALARKAMEYGYVVEVVPEIIKLHKR